MSQRSRDKSLDGVPRRVRGWRPAQRSRGNFHAIRATNTSGGSVRSGHTGGLGGCRAARAHRSCAVDPDTVSGNPKCADVGLFGFKIEGVPPVGRYDLPGSRRCLRRRGRRHQRRPAARLVVELRDRSGDREGWIGRQHLRHRRCSQRHRLHGAQELVGRVGADQPRRVLLRRLRDADDLGRHHRGRRRPRGGHRRHSAHGTPGVIDQPRRRRRPRQRRRHRPAFLGADRRRRVRRDRSAVLGDRPAVLRHRSAVLRDRSEVLRHEYPVLGDRSAVLGDRSAVLGDRSALQRLRRRHARRGAIGRHGSALRAGPACVSPVPACASASCPVGTFP